VRDIAGRRLEEEVRGREEVGGEARLSGIPGGKLEEEGGEQEEW
jgi:hypothetical protein